MSHQTPDNNNKEEITSPISNTSPSSPTTSPSPQPNNNNPHPIANDAESHSPPSAADSSNSPSPPPVQLTPLDKELQLLRKAYELLCVSSGVDKRIAGIKYIADQLYYLTLKEEYLRRQQRPGGMNLFNYVNPNQNFLTATISSLTGNINNHQEPDYLKMSLTAEAAIQFLTQNKILEILLDPVTSHIELIRRSFQIYLFLIQHNQLDNLDSISNNFNLLWQFIFNPSTHESILHVCYEILTKLSNSMNNMLLQYNFKQLKSLPYNQYNTQLLLLLRDFSLNAFKFYSDPNNNPTTNKTNKPVESSSPSPTPKDNNKEINSTNITNTQEKSLYFAVPIFWDLLQKQDIASTATIPTTNSPDLNTINEAKSNNNDISSEISAISEDYFIELLSSDYCIGQRHKYTEQCILYLKACTESSSPVTSSPSAANSDISTPNSSTLPVLSSTPNLTISHVYSLLERILRLYPLQLKSAWNLWSNSTQTPQSIIIESLQDRHQIVNLVIKTMEQEKNKYNQQNNQQLLQSHLDSMYRLHSFLIFLLTHSSLTLSQSNLDQIWSISVLNSAANFERDIVYYWLLNGADLEQNFNSSIQQILSEELKLYLFKQKLLTLDAQTLTEIGFQLIQTYFLYANQKLNNIKMERRFRADNNLNNNNGIRLLLPSYAYYKRYHHIPIPPSILNSFNIFVYNYSELFGISYLWQILLEHPNNAIATQSILLLNEIHTKLSNKIEAQHKTIKDAHIQKCLNNLTAALNNNSSNNQAKLGQQEQMIEQQRTIGRCVQLLQHFLSQFNKKNHSSSNSNQFTLRIQLSKQFSMPNFSVQLPYHSSTILDLRESIFHHLLPYHAGLAKQHLGLSWANKKLVSNHLYLKNIQDMVNNDIINVRKECDSFQLTVPLSLKEFYQQKANQPIVNPPKLYTQFPIDQYRNLAKNVSNKNQHSNNTIHNPTNKTNNNVDPVLASIAADQASFQRLFALLGANSICADSVYSILVLLPLNPDYLREFLDLSKTSASSWSESTHLSLTAPYRCLYGLRVLEAILNNHIPSSSSLQPVERVDWLQKFLQTGGLDHLIRLITGQRFLNQAKTSVEAMKTYSLWSIQLFKIIRMILLTDPIYETKEESKQNEQLIKLSSGNLSSNSSGLNSQLIALILRAVIPLSINLASNSNNTNEINTDNNEEDEDDNNNNTESQDIANQLLINGLQLFSTCIQSNTDLLTSLLTLTEFDVYFCSNLFHSSAELVRNTAKTTLFKLYQQSITVKNNQLTIFLIHKLANWLGIQTETEKSESEQKTEVAGEKSDESTNNYFTSSAIVQQYPRNSEQYFDLLNSILLLPESSKSNFDSQLLIRLPVYLLELLAKHATIEKSNDYLLTDPYLFGIITLLQTSVANPLISIHITDQVKEELLDFLLTRCLFSIEIQSNKSNLCFSSLSRSAAYYLLNDLAARNTNCEVKLLNYLNSNSFLWFTQLYNSDDKLILKPRTKWNYEPSVLQKSSNQLEVGLKNQSATCYQNSFLQQLFHIKKFKQQLLQIQEKNEEINNKDKEDGGNNNNNRALLPRLLPSLQFLFSALEHSEHSYYDTLEFCLNLRDSNGNPINLGEQKDVQEFAGELFDKLNNELTQLNQKQYVNLVNSIFRGVIVNQMISKDCIHRSEREEPYTMISLTIQNKSNLEQSLQSWISGDLLDGENKYYCADCKNKVVALKRACLSSNSLPQYFILHLKRFEFDFDTMRKLKINDYFEFPLSFNVEPYTNTGLAKREAKENDTNNNSTSNNTNEIDLSLFDYELVGIIIHTGQADAGHYYSLIKTDNGHWTEYNDTAVTPFNPNYIPAVCFGGKEIVDQFDPKTRQKYQKEIEKINNAYMLIYKRKIDISNNNETTNPENNTQPDETIDSIETPTTAGESTENGTIPATKNTGSHTVQSTADAAVTTVDSAAANNSDSLLSTVPSHVRAIQRLNQEFLIEKNVFDFSFQAFVWNQIKSTNETKESEDDLALARCELTVNYVFNLLIYSTDNHNFPVWMDEIQRFLKNSIQCQKWFINKLLTQKEWFELILFQSPHPIVRSAFAHLILFSIQQFIEANQNQHDDKQLLELYDLLLNYLKNSSLTRYYKSYSQYFILLDNLFSLSPYEQHYFLVPHQLISLITQFYTDFSIAIPNFNMKRGFQNDASKRIHPPNMQYAIQLLTKAILASKTDTNRDEKLADLQNIDREHILHGITIQKPKPTKATEEEEKEKKDENSNESKNNPHESAVSNSLAAFLPFLLSDKQHSMNLRNCIQIVLHWCNNNLPFSLEMLGIGFKNLTAEYKQSLQFNGLQLASLTSWPEFKPSLQFIQAILLLNDQANYIDSRVDYALSEYFKLESILLQRRHDPTATPQQLQTEQRFSVALLENLLLLAHQSRPVYNWLNRKDKQAEWNNWQQLYKTNPNINTRTPKK